MRRGNVMTTKRNATHIRIGREPPASGARPSAGRRRMLGAAVLGGAALAAVGVFAWVGASGNAHASALNCAATPSQCGYPDATNTGVPSGTTLKTVPGQVSSGPGWSYNTGGWVNVTGNGASLTGLKIPYNVNITGNNVTLNDDQITTGGPNSFGVSLRHTAGVTVENTTITGTDGGANQV